MLQNVLHRTSVQQIPDFKKKMQQINYPAGTTL